VKFLILARPLHLLEIDRFNVLDDLALALSPVLPLLVVLCDLSEDLYALLLEGLLLLP